MGGVCSLSMAQNITDVLRLSTENINGTARYQAMGGAFGALGGDLSGINNNPAGSAVFNYGQFTVTGTNYNRNNEAFYGNSFTTNQLNSVEFNQVGGVFVFESPESAWKKIALAFNYDMVQNFDNEYIARGNSSQGVDNYFLNYAQGVPFGPLQLQAGEFVEDAYLDIGASLGFADQQAFLGYQAGIISPTTNNNDETSYLSNAEYSQVNQTWRQVSNGYNSKFTANFSGQYEDNLYVGAALNFHSVLSERFQFLDESGYDADSPIQRANLDSYLLTEGDGFSFSLGAIAKLNDGLRLGASYQSPTWYRLTDDFAQQVGSNAPLNTELRFIDFSVANLYPEYRIKTPAKLTGSAALVFGKEGLLSFDYGYQDFSQAQLRPAADPAFADENNFIAQTLGPVNSYRIGGEYRIKNISLRGGYHLEESPYENSNIIGDLERISGGIGYSFGANRIDVAYSRAQQDRNELFFDSGIIGNNTDISIVNTNVSIAYTLKF